jgi:hypothetical protein
VTLIKSQSLQGTGSFAGIVALEGFNEPLSIDSSFLNLSKAQPANVRAMHKRIIATTATYQTLVSEGSIDGAR